MRSFFAQALIVPAIGRLVAAGVVACLTAATFAFAETPAAERVTTWEPTKWHDEPSWKSVRGQALAIVSESRGRLIYLGGIDGASNLLSAPAERGELLPGKPSPNWGGHRFWLGPQSRWGWPPPADWEFSSAVSAEAEGDRLILNEPRKNTAYPAIIREYAWQGNRLRCTARWKPGANSLPYYGMHVVPIEAPAVMNVGLVKSDDVPLGIVGIHGDKPDTAKVLPVASVTVDGDRATVTSGIVTSKLGFHPQMLQVKRGSWTLFVHPGPTHGVMQLSPDHGYTSQIWVGEKRYDFCELEQITPFLNPGEDGWCGSTIYLEAKHD
ncbi:MAG TPA: hypothetical protein VFT72_16885 [Opitutaceae bacterium]|nr:hypothetical protein [Opitutaceae bacterium]